MRSLLLFVAVSSICGSDVYAADAREIFKAAVENYDRDHLKALRYSYTETDLNSSGKSVSQITVIEGTPYERVISRNGVELSGEAEKIEERKYRKAVEERKRETAEQRRARIAKYQSDVKIFQEAPTAFVPKLLAEDSLAGRAAYVLEITPNPTYQAGSVRTKILTKIQAKLWIDKQDLRIVKADATVIDMVALGWIMARVSKGGHLEMQQERLPEGIWLPRKFEVQGKARLFLVDDKKLDQTVTFHGFQRISHDAATELSKDISPTVTQTPNKLR
jgi:hypothetical protein